MVRTPLSPITPNIIRRKELTPFQRGIVVGQASAGYSTASTKHLFSIPESTIRGIISNADTQDHGKSRPRPGRPKTTSDQDERAILRIAQSDPKSTYQDLIQRSGVTCSRKTVYRILSHVSITNWLVNKRILLRP